MSKNNTITTKQKILISLYIFFAILTIANIFLNPQKSSNSIIPMLFAIICIGEHHRDRRKNNKEKKNKTKKEIISHFFIIIFSTILLIISTFFVFIQGNPITNWRIKNTAKEYIKKDKFKDYELTNFHWDMKFDHYTAEYKIPNSKDRHFKAHFSRNGKLKYDEYDAINKKENTYNRVNQQYNKLFDKIKDKKYSLVFGEILTTTDKEDGLNIKTLKIDKNYNVKKLGKNYGKVYITIEGRKTSEVNLMTIKLELLKIKKTLDKNKIGFKYIDLDIDNFIKTKDGEIKNKNNQKTIFIENFPYEKIKDNKDIIIELKKNSQKANTNSQKTKD